ncbi:MAG: DUF4422 domain-containing protein [Lachnospiraceae bacterium]|nr:DUF4422 domain-containing protein [Lachnospiraceae bacterium]
MSTTIFAMTHKKFIPPSDKMYVPLHVGCEGKDDLGYLGDNTGDNISSKNVYYSELTGVYWVWKNFHDADNVGICHYRRFLVNDGGRLFTENEIESLLSRYDLITTKTLTMRYPYYDGFSHNHNLADLEAALEVVKEMYPEYYDTFNTMVHKRETWFGNIMICKKALFDEYCSWLFTIFFEMEKRIDVENYDDYHKRIYGFISEFLLYVWATVNHLKVYQCKVGMLGEKAETKELKLALSDFFEKKDIQGAKQFILKALEKRPDVLMEASDLDGELKLAMQVITTCENEYKSYGGCILDIEKEFERLISYFRKLNEIIEHIRCGEMTNEDEVFLKEKYIDGLAVTEIAIEISILLMCSKDCSVERVRAKVKGIIYGV